jgi:type IV pilus assembly protein PilP
MKNRILNQLQVLILGCSMLFIISGCSHSTDDLAQFTANVQSTTPVSLEPSPEFHALPDYQYQATALRSPFISPITVVPTQVSTQRGNCRMPNFTRRTTALEAYGIDAIAMSGVLRINSTAFALFKTNDGKLHKAKIGHYLGLFHGKITHIGSDHVLVDQLIPDGAGCYQSKQTRIVIATDAGDNIHA